LRSFGTSSDARSAAPVPGGREPWHGRVCPVSRSDEHDGHHVLDLAALRGTAAEHLSGAICLLCWRVGLDPRWLAASTAGTSKDTSEQCGFRGLFACRIYGERYKLEACHRGVRASCGISYPQANAKSIESRGRVTDPGTCRIGNPATGGNKPAREARRDTQCRSTADVCHGMT
jgi:hypothetical protein